MIPAHSILAVDLGKTSCRAALWRPGAAPVLAHGDGAPGLAFADGVWLAAQAIMAVATPLLAAGGPMPVLMAGTAGALTDPAAMAVLARHLAAALPVGRAGVTSDAVIAHAGALGGAPGVVLSIGTGAVALALREDGRLHRVDGWGPALGDEGGGAWIGQAGLRAALRAVDGRGPATTLRGAAQRRFGAPDLIVRRAGTDPNPAQLIAAFAPDVAHAATTGDAVAQGILRQAAAALASDVQAGIQFLGGARVPVAVIGGLLALGAALTDPLDAALLACTGAVVRPAMGSALDGARLLAVRQAGPAASPHLPHVAWGGA